MLHLRRIDSSHGWRDFFSLTQPGRSHSVLNRIRSVFAESSEAGLFRFEEHPFYRHGLAAAFVVYDGAIPVARVAAAIDLDFIRERRERVGFLGFLASREGTAFEAAELLVKAASDWMRSEGVKAALGPVDLDFWRSSRLAKADSSDRYWTDALTRLGWAVVDRGAVFRFQPSEASWPAAFEARAEVARQATRVQLIESQSHRDRSGRLSSWLNPGGLRDSIESDLRLRDWVSRSDLVISGKERREPWERFPSESEWLAWRREDRGAVHDLRVEVLGSLAAWVHIREQLGSAVSRNAKPVYRVVKTEWDLAYRDFDLLPWIVMEVCRWAQTRGAGLLEWDVPTLNCILARALTDAFDSQSGEPTVLLGTALRG